MPGTGPDRPKTRQARTLRWLLENAHTSAMPRMHRTSREISALPIFGHGEIKGQNTLCPGRFLWMYKHRGLPWRDEESLMVEDEFFVAPEDEAGELPLPQDAPDDATGPDEDEARAEADPDDESELPEADPEFDEDLSHTGGPEPVR